MKIYLQIFLVLIFPVALLVFGIVPLNSRGYVLSFAVLGATIFAITEKTSLKSLGIRFDNFKMSLLPYTLFTTLGVIGLFLAANFLGQKPVDQWWTYSHLQCAFLPISFVQELAYRAYFQTKLQRRVKPFLAILVIAFLYSGMHILWKDPLILAMAFVGGLSWGYLWYKYPNLILLVLSHSILNFLAIYLNFFPWLITEFFSLK